MTTRLLIASAVLSLLTTGCDGVTKVEEPGRADLFEVHLSSSFSDVAVALELDGKEVFRGRLSNDIPHDSGSEVSPFDLAGVVSADLNVGEHRLAVIVDGAVREETVFEIEDTLVIIVAYSHETGAVRFTFLNEVPLYG